MKIRQKFFVLAALVGVIMAVMSCVGYYVAYSNLEQSVEGELSATVGAEAQGLDGWIHGKSNYAVAAAEVMPTVGNKGDIANMQSLLKMVASDKEIVGLVNATETGTFVSAKKDNTGKVNPQERGWYKQAKAANGKLSFTEVYKDSTNGKLVVTAAMPYEDGTGKFAGAICEDIELGTLEEAVANLKYHGEGKGLLISPKGNIIASTDESENMKPVSDNAALAAHFDEMVQNGAFRRNGAERRRLFRGRFVRGHEGHRLSFRPDDGLGHGDFRAARRRLRLADEAQDCVRHPDDSRHPDCRRGLVEICGQHFVAHRGHPQPCGRFRGRRPLAG